MKRESVRRRVDLESTRGDPLYPAGCLQCAAEGKEMRRDDLRRKRRRQESEQVLIRAEREMRSMRGRIEIAHQGAHRRADAAVNGEMQEPGHGRWSGDAHAYG